jgi:hypothetical protein
VPVSVPGTQTGIPAHFCALFFHVCDEPRIARALSVGGSGAVRRADDVAGRLDRGFRESIGAPSRRFPPVCHRVERAGDERL